MILSDLQILRAIEIGDIQISPFNRDSLGSNSYDLHLSPHYALYKDEKLDAKKDNPLRRFLIPEEGLTLYPNTLYLMSTVEHTESYNCVPCVETKSSVARLGISAHLTAGFGDNGFTGHWTLEVTCVKPVTIYAGMPFVQIYWEETGVCLNPYNKKSDAKYSEQSELPQGSKMIKNFM